MIKKVADLALEYITGKLTDHIDEQISDFKDKREFKEFRESLENWTNDFIRRYETSIIERSEFDDYLTHYNIVEHMFCYIIDENFSQDIESQFIAKKIDEVVKYLNSRGRSITSDDNSIITEFVNGLFELIKKYFYTKASIDQRALIYAITQLMRKTCNLAPEPSRVTSEKLRYDHLSDIIERKAVPFKYIQDSNICLHMDEVDDLYEICQKERRIVLLGDAGCGKTTVLKQVSHHACDDYHTLFISLSDYSGQEIDYLISNSYPDYKSLSLFLIFDAFDEAGERNRDTFARKLNLFISNYPRTTVLISVRNNFYMFSCGEEGVSKFTEFKEYGLYPLTGNDIRDYSERNGIDFQTFNAELNRNGLRTLSYNPFYLVNLIKLMKEKSHLPAKRELMNEIIKMSFRLDKNKFMNPDIVYEREYDLRRLLQKVAFAMQCMEDKVHISTINYQHLFNVEERKLLCYSSLFLQNDNEEWQFEHNNFREYLAAEYLGDLELETIKEVLCCNKEKTKIRESWENVISYLVLIYERNDLFEWMKDISDSLLVKFEISRVDDVARNDIFIKIFNSYAEKNMWINHGQNSVEELVNFGQSATTLKFLLKEIENPRHYWALSNALNLLNSFDNLYNKDEAIRNVLYECIISNEIREYEKKTAICTLANLDLQTTEITISLINMLESEKSEYFHNGVVYYIIHCNLQEDYIDVLLNELEYSDKHYKGYACNIGWKVKNAILQIQGKNAIQKILEYYSSKENHSSDKKEIFQHLIDRMIYFYQNGDHMVFDVVFRTLLSSQNHYHTILADNYNQFFTQTNTVSKAFDKAVELYLQGAENNDIVFEFLFYLVDDENIEKLIKHYEEQPAVYGQLFLSFTVNLAFDNKYLSRCTELLQINGVEVPPPRKPIDYEGIRKQGNQIYFDSLFDGEKYQNLIEKLVEMVGEPQITYDTIQDKFLNIQNYETIEHEMLMPVVWDIHEINFEDQQVLHFTSHIQDWDGFSISNIYKCISTNYYKIDITEAQKNYINIYCDYVIQAIDFSAEISDKNNNEVSYSWRLLYFCFFTDYFSFEYSKEIVKKLTVVPRYLFDRNYSDERIFSNYITTHLTFDELCECVKNNIENRSLCLWSKMEHIKFCKENKLPYALQLAEEICLNPKIDSYNKYIVLEYIAIIKDDEKNGYDYIYSNFLASEDENLLNAIIDVTMSIQSPRLVLRLEEININSDNKDKYLLQLIKLQSKLGLQRYYEIAEEKMKTPDYSEDNYTALTEAISQIDRLELLPLLIQLQDLLFTEDFVDHSPFGLHNSLSKALINTAKKHDEAVFEALEKCLNKENIAPRERSFCNFIIINIENACKQKNDTPWSIQKIKHFLKENE